MLQAGQDYSLVVMYLSFLVKPFCKINTDDLRMYQFEAFLETLRCIFLSFLVHRWYIYATDTFVVNVRLLVVFCECLLNAILNGRRVSL